jgi:hypothetical protein
MRFWTYVALIGLAAGVAVQAATPAKPAYCINDDAEFYPYKSGDNCKKGYQLGEGNCRLKDGDLVAVAKTECVKMGGDVSLPAPAVRLPGEPSGADATLKKEIVPER